ncbi:MAG: AbrB/MazE/SpoVT family DNA-binding domain-containing protein [Hyphomicrobiaceae bacterium]
MKVAKWGNSLAVRLPADLVEALGLKEGDEIELVPGESGLAVARIPDRLELLAELRKLRGTRPADYKFDREEANAREPGAKG